MTESKPEYMAKQGRAAEEIEIAMYDHGIAGMSPVPIIIRITAELPMCRGVLRRTVRCYICCIEKPAYRYTEVVGGAVV